MAAPASRLTQNTLSSQACDTVHRLKGAVCQIDTKSPGTGFLVTPNCLLTCCHVLPEKEIAQNAYACFSDIQEAISVALNPDPLKNGFYHASKLERSGFTAKHLDFVLVALSQTIEKASDLFVLNDQFPPQKERIHVIQHPVIEVMKRDPDTNRPLEIKQLTGEKRIATGQVTEFDQYTIHHTAPVAGGASGAPIVNDAGHLYAFHQAECTNPAHKKCSNPEHNRSKNPVHKDCEIQVNCGIGVRTDAVFRYLKSEQISLDVFDEQRKCAALKAKYAKQSHLELVRPVRGYKDWILKFPIEAIYTELVILHTPIKKKEHDTSSNPHRGLQTYETLFTDKESISREKFLTLLKDSKKLLVLGAAGMGKTTFCQHLAIQWSKDSILTEYQALFWIRLRHLKENDTLEVLFQREFGFTPLDRHLRCSLLILDGFDELPTTTEAETLFRQLTTQFQHVIVTSRPKTNIPFPSTARLEIIGLNTTNSNSYIEHYFNALHDQYPDELSKEEILPKAYRLQRLLMTHSLLASLAHIPVNLSLLCAIFSQEEDFLKDRQSITVIALYDYIVNWLYTYFQIRQKELLASTSDSMSDLTSQNNPLSDSVVRNLDYILCEIALKYTQNNTLYVSQTELENFLIEQNSTFKVNRLNDSGLFKIERGEGEFIHLSYQDFFVARHLVNLYAKNQREKAQKFVKTYKLQERYKWIFWMTAGLLSIRYPTVLPQYFDDLQALAPDFGKSYELKLLARCYEECLHPDALLKYSEFLKSVVNYLKEHPSLNAKTELFRDCPRLLNQSAIIQSVCDFSFEELTKLIDQFIERQQHIPNQILETLCSKSKQPRMKQYPQWDHRANALFTLIGAASSNRKLSTPCLEFVLSFLRDPLNKNLALLILSNIFKQQIVLGSLENAVKWLKNLALPPETYFCLFVEGLKGHHKDPKNQAIFVSNSFIQQSEGELLGLGGLSPQEMFNKLLSITSDSNYLHEVNDYILELFTSLLWIESVSSLLPMTDLVKSTLDGNQKSAHALKELIRIGYSISDIDLTELIEQFKKEQKEKSQPKYFLVGILSEIVKSEHDSSGSILTLLNEHRYINALVDIAQAKKKHSEETFQLILQDLESYIYIHKYRLNPINLLKAPYTERIAEELLKLFFIHQTINSVAKALSRLALTGYFFTLEVIDYFIQFLKGNHEHDYAQNWIVDILCDIINIEHPHLHTILEKIEQELANKDFPLSFKEKFAQALDKVQGPVHLLSHSARENRSGKALVDIVQSQKKHSEEASQQILQDLKSDIYFLLEDRRDLEDLLKAHNIENISKVLLKLFSSHQSMDSVTKALSRLAFADYFFPIEVIDYFIHFVRENHEHNYEQSWIIDILCNMINMGHPDSHAILEKIERALANKDLSIKFKEKFAQILSKVRRPVHLLSHSVIKALVSCIPDSSLERQTNSIYIINIGKITELWKIESTLFFILKQPSVRLSHNSLLNLTALDGNNNNIESLINILSLLDYSNYSQEPWSRELFSKIAYLTGQPFIEEEQG